MRLQRLHVIGNIGVGKVKMTEFEKINGELLPFIIMSFILIIGHSLLLFRELFITNERIQGYYSIIPLLFFAIQLSRMFYQGMEYDGWFNGEIKYASHAVISIGVLPILGFQIVGFTGILYWTFLVIFVLIIIYMMLNLAKLFSVKGSFYSDEYSLKGIEDVLNQKELRYKKSEKKPNKITDIEKTTLYLPDHECRIFKIKEKVFVKPINRKGKTKLFDVIDLIEKMLSKKNGELKRELRRRGKSSV